MDRRSFISLVSALAATYNFKLPYRARAEELNLASGTAAAGGFPDIVAVMGGTPVEMLDRALTAAGGLSRFVKQGQKVLVKPNIGWDKTPEEGANTNPTLVKHLIQLCFKAGAKEVNVFDNTCNHWQACYSNSQIEAAVKEAGGTMLMAHEESYYTEIDLPHGVALKKAKVHKAWLESDVIINLPILKHHGGARMTAAMKNLMGVIWDRRHYHRTDLHQCIADFTTIDKKPTLNIIDAYSVMMRNGPRGVSTADLATKKMLLLSTDMVAIDTAAARILEAQPDEIAYIAMAAALNTGIADLSKLKIERITI
ncbi:MAG: tat (twin-arginine translocation) pathway signal sequence [Candidatus Riflebacteria bacterium HGW-Riflebacteria-1]|jgi:uncharacterized protein (DUF362 family)|nr:MAG: tat (twin-arginine translocation) pathway signal sequence [Candidatus Riflebacteria bacterium HGW-Riflebacteria-1]